MSLTATLSHALSGLRANEAGVETAARNIAGAGVEGYARRSLATVERGGGGVATGEIQRVFDAAVQRQLRSESAGQGFTAVTAAALAQLDSFFGAPGAAQALDTVFNEFSAALSSLAAEPAGAAARAEVIATAQGLAGGLNRMAGKVQDARNDADAAIRASVEEVNAALATIEDAERQLAALPGGHGRADVLDARDRAIDALARLADIRVSERGAGRIAIHTTGGAVLFAGKASRLTFEPVHPLVAGAEGGGIGMTDGEGHAQPLHSGLLRSGEIAGLLALRDETLPALQQGLDAVAAGLARAASEAGAAVFVDAGNGVATQPFAGGAQETGFSGRIAVDPALARDPSALSPGGSPATAQALVAALAETTRSFAAPTPGAAPFQGDVGAALRHLLDRQASQAAEAAQLDEGQGVVVAALSARAAEVSGVSVDAEMAQLVDLQNAYAANARVVSVVQDMFDALMNI